MTSRPSIRPPICPPSPPVFRRCPTSSSTRFTGTGGEDGTIQAILDLLGVPYTHSGMRASAVAMDKPLAKRVVGTVGVPSPAGLVVSAKLLADGHPMPAPYVVKPVAEGIERRRHDRARRCEQPAPTDGWSADEQLLVEPYIKGGN